METATNDQREEKTKMPPLKEKEGIVGCRLYGRVTNAMGVRVRKRNESAWLHADT
jgi:hypothetical protein